MSTRIPFLSALVLISSAFPTQAARIGMAAVATSAVRSAVQLRLAAVAVAVAGLAWYVAPDTGVVWLADGWTWYAAAAALGCLAPAVEIGVGLAVAWLRRLPVRRVALHERWPDFSALAVLAAVAIGTAEEVALRGVGLAVLDRSLGWPVAVAVAMTAAVYGLNHLHFGWLTVAQKTVTGLLLGALFVSCGLALAVPIVAHVLQNLVVLLVLPRILSPARAPVPAQKPAPAQNPVPTRKPGPARAVDRG